LGREPNTFDLDDTASNIANTGPIKLSAAGAWCLYTFSAHHY
jgi:hypothetical protein